MSFIPSDQPLRWLVGKQDMISRKQVSVPIGSTHSTTQAVPQKLRENLWRRSASISNY